jgi:hypothetical protein
MLFFTRRLKMPMMSDKAWKICQKNGGIWGEHENYRKVDWVWKCEDNTTVLGYWDWVVASMEQEEYEDEN